MSIDPRGSLSAARAGLIGYIAGVLNGLIGIGGGIVIVPALILYRGASPQVAVGSSLAAMVMLSSAAFLAHVWLTGVGMPLWALAALMGAGVVGAQLGAMILAHLTARWMLLLFAGFVLIMSARLLAQGVGIVPGEALWTGAPPPWSYAAIGFASGVLSGVFGVGGGGLVLLGFAVLFGLEVHAGLPLALAVNVTNALAGGVRHALAGRVLWREVGRMVPAALVGIVTGAAAAIWLPPDELRIVFGGFFVYMALRLSRQAMKR